jgi:hypothetical protein
MEMEMGTIMDITPRTDLVTRPTYMGRTHSGRPTTTTKKENSKDVRKPKDGPRGIESGQIESGDKRKLLRRVGEGRGSGKIDYRVIRIDWELDYIGKERDMGVVRAEGRRRGVRDYLGICLGDHDSIWHFCRSCRVEWNLSWNAVYLQYCRYVDSCRQGSVVTGYPCA